MKIIDYINKEIRKPAFRTASVRFGQTLAGGMMACLMLASCSDADSIPNVDPAYCPEKIELNIPAELQQLIYVDNTGAEVLPLIKGETVSLGYTLSPENITYNDVNWTSSNPDVATVSDGTIEALSGNGMGFSIISVMPVGMYPGSGVNSTLKVKVSNQLMQATDITIYADADEVYEGENIQLTADIMPEVATYRTVKWTSSDESIAAVDNKGVVTGVKVPGNGTSCKVTITATALDNSGVSASCDLTVKRIVAPEDITLDQSFAAPDYLCAIADKSVTLNYTTYPADCTTSLIEWTSSDESIATVKNGVVTFNQSGNFGDFTITATCPETGKTSSIKMSMPAGLIRELFHDQNNYTWYNAKQSGNGTSSSHEWHYGYVTVTTYKQNATNQRGDFKCWSPKTWICPANYPLFAIRMEDVKDKYAADGCTSRAINLDTSGSDLATGTKFSGNVGGNNNKWKHDIKCSDGSHVFIYDFTTQAFANGGIFPANNIGEFTTFQLKYADMRTLTNQITYNVYWIQTFKTVDDIKAYLDSEGLTYEQVQ